MMKQRCSIKSCSVFVIALLTLHNVVIIWLLNFKCIQYIIKV